MARQSAYACYLNCNRSFKICQEMETPPSKAMIDGLIFEGLLLGWKSEEDKELCHTKAGKLNAPAVRLQVLAEKVKRYFGTGVHHQRIEVGTTTGEPDFIGQFKPEDQFIEAIVDIKLTKDINKIWDWKNRKEEYLQAVSYTWLHLKKTGEVLPFYYFVVEDNDYAEPIIRIIHMTVTEDDFKWFEHLVFTADNDIFLEPNSEKCLGKSSFDPRCRYLEKCEHGRSLVGGKRLIHFGQLNSDFNVDESKNEDWSVIKNEKKKVYNENFDIAGDLVETDIGGLETKEPAPVTVCNDDLRDTGYICRNCRTAQIQKNDTNCDNCKAKIIWMGE